MDGKRNQTIRRILKYIARYRGRVILSILLAAVSVAATLYIPILIGQGVDQIIGAEAVEFKELLQILKKIGILTILIAILQWLKKLLTIASSLNTPTLSNNITRYHLV